MRLPSLAVLTLLAAPLAAQAPQRAAAPAPGVVKRHGEWNIRYDRPGTPDSSFRIDVSAPGFHVVTNGRGSAIAWRPNQTASGNFRADLETIFIPTAGASHAEGYGMILGGSNLDADNQSYLYFLIRKDGQFMIKHRAGNDLHDIINWTPSAAITQPQGTGNANNTLSVQARADSIIFMVNNQRVHAQPRSGVVNGLVGLRINHALTIHVSRLAVTQQ